MYRFTPIPDVVEMFGAVGLAAFERAQALTDQTLVAPPPNPWPADRCDDFWANSGLESGHISPDVLDRIKHLSLI